MDLLIWGGPVYADTPGKVAWRRPTTSLVRNTGIDGIGSNAFAALAESLRDASGHILPNLLAAAGATRGQFDKVAIAGFSAFHGLAAPLLAADGDAIDACVLHDACFSSYAGLEKRGYVSFGARAARGEKLFVATASAGGGGEYSTGFECVWANANAAAASAGRALQPYTPPASLPVPARGARAGNLIVLDYQGAYMHGDHVNQLGVPVLDAFLAPYLAGEFGSSGALTTLSRPLVVLAGLGLGYLAGSAALELLET